MLFQNQGGNGRYATFFISGAAIAVRIVHDLRESRRHWLYAESGPATFVGCLPAQGNSTSPRSHSWPITMSPSALAAANVQGEPTFSRPWARPAKRLSGPSGRDVWSRAQTDSRGSPGVAAVRAERKARPAYRTISPGLFQGPLARASCPHRPAVQLGRPIALPRPGSARSWRSWWAPAGGAGVFLCPTGVRPSVPASHGPWAARHCNQGACHDDTARLCFRRWKRGTRRKDQAKLRLTNPTRHL